MDASGYRGDFAGFLGRLGSFRFLRHNVALQQGAQQTGIKGVRSSSRPPKLDWCGRRTSNLKFKSLTLFGPCVLGSRTMLLSLPRDVTKWLRHVFYSCSSRVSAKMSYVPTVQADPKTPGLREWGDI